MNKAAFDELPEALKLSNSDRITQTGKDSDEWKISLAIGSKKNAASELRFASA